MKAVDARVKAVPYRPQGGRAARPAIEDRVAAALLPRMAERQRQAVSGLDTVSDTLRKDRDRALAAAAERVRAAAPDLSARA
jgi:hypothetical protein